MPVTRRRQHTDGEVTKGPLETFRAMAEDGIQDRPCIASDYETRHRHIDLAGTMRQRERDQMHAAPAQSKHCRVKRSISLQQDGERRCGPAEWGHQIAWRTWWCASMKTFFLDLRHHLPHWGF